MARKMCIRDRIVGVAGGSDVRIVIVQGAGRRTAAAA